LTFFYHKSTISVKGADKKVSFLFCSRHLPVLPAKTEYVPSSGILHSGLPMLLALADFHGRGMVPIFHHVRAELRARLVA
jgi:hypothetical protein